MRFYPHHILLFAGLFITILMSSCRDEAVDNIQPESGLKVGDYLDDFTLEDSQGDQVSLSDFKKKTVLIEFWASWCSYCNAEAPKLNLLYEDYRDQEFEILGVSIDEVKDAWISGIQKHNINYTQVNDPKGFDAPLIKKYDIHSIPKMILVDGEGKVLLITMKSDEVRKILQQHLK
jgi:peroxiredoxin